MRCGAGEMPPAGRDKVPLASGRDGPSPRRGRLSGGEFLSPRRERNQSAATAWCFSLARRERLIFLPNCTKSEI